MNALLGAMAEGDIGTHFPDSDPRYKNIESAKLLAEVLAMMRRKRFKLINADVTLVAQEPRLAPHYKAIKTKVAGYFKVDKNRINIKASTTEKLGWAGKGEGMSATAVVLLAR
jgi:2-C-methyl-D-erythritol 2,4-cyclodiphosphate synthase